MRIMCPSAARPIFEREPAPEADAFSRVVPSSQAKASTSLFEIQGAGPEVVVRPRQPRMPPVFDVQEERENLETAVKYHGADGIVFDLRRLRSFSSSFLSLLVVLYRSNLAVSVTHPPSYMREVLKTTRLNELIHVR